MLLRTFEKISRHVRKVRNIMPESPERLQWHVPVTLTGGPEGFRVSP
jgi:hypothetical protein